MEIILFLIVAGAFYFLINKAYSDGKPFSGIVTVGEKAAEKAEDEFNIYEGVNEEDIIKTLLEKAKRLAKAGAYRNAENMYLEVIKKDPKNIEAHKGMGDLYLNEENYDGAATYFEKVTVLDAEDEYSWNNLGIIYYEEENFKKAIYAYEKAIYLDKKDPEKLMNISIVHAKLDDFEEAISFLEKSLKIKPTKDGYRFLYSLYKKTGDVNKAIKAKKNMEELSS